MFINIRNKILTPYAVCMRLIPFIRFFQSIRKQHCVRHPLFLCRYIQTILIVIKAEIVPLFYRLRVVIPVLNVDFVSFLRIILRDISAAKYGSACDK